MLGEHAGNTDMLSIAGQAKMETPFRIRTSCMSNSGGGSSFLVAGCWCSEKYLKLAILDRFIDRVKQRLNPFPQNTLLCVSQTAVVKDSERKSDVFRARVR